MKNSRMVLAQDEPTGVAVVSAIENGEHAYEILRNGQRLGVVYSIGRVRRALRDIDPKMASRLTADAAAPVLRKSAPGAEPDAA